MVASCIYSPFSQVIEKIFWRQYKWKCLAGNEVTTINGLPFFVKFEIAIKLPKMFPNPATSAKKGWLKTPKKCYLHEESLTQ